MNLTLLPASPKRRDFKELAKRAYFFMVAFSVVFAIGLVFFVLFNAYFFVCYEKKIEITPIIAEGCGNGICDLEEYRLFLQEGATVCIDCFLVPHCRIMDFTASSKLYFVDWNGKQEWVSQVLGFCSIDTNNNPFIIGEIEYEWNGNFSHFGLGQEPEYRCKTFLSWLKNPKNSN